MTHQPGIDEGKIDGLTLHVSFYAFQGTRTYDARPQLRRVCYTHEERDVNRRGEMWISEAFHLANLPTISRQGLQNSALSCPLHVHDYSRLYATSFVPATHRLSRICSPS